METIMEAWRRQWSDYACYHRSRYNLLLHVFAVPLFLAGNGALIVASLQHEGWLAMAGIVAMLVSLAAQGRSHRREALPPAPFAGAADAVRRILLKQWVTFPCFVLSGGWWRAWRAATTAMDETASGARQAFRMFAGREISTAHKHVPNRTARSHRE